MAHFRDVGHGHVWERPDGMKARCGGEAICRDCYYDAQRLRLVHGTFNNAIDIAILVRTKDVWQERALAAERELLALKEPEVTVIHPDGSFTGPRPIAMGLDLGG